MQTQNYTNYEQTGYVDYESPQKQGPVIPVFRRPHPEEMIVNEFETHKQGHTVYVDMIFCEIRIPANRELVPVFPASAVWKKVPDERGVLRPVTYAQRFKREYDAFMKGEAPSVQGIPIEELPFLGVAKRMELKGMGVVTVEILASLEGAQAKNLGIGGHELVGKARAWLENIQGTAEVTKYAAENVALKEMMAELRKEIDALKSGKTLADVPVENKEEAAEATGSGFDFWSDADLQKYIHTETGHPADGRWSRARLIEKAIELSKGKPEE